MVNLTWTAKSHVGKARSQNEDSFYAGTRVFGVADGLGGHRAGEVASRIAADCLAKLDGRSRRDFNSALETVFRKANSAIYDRAAAEPDMRGMSTTLTAIAVDDEGIAHIGHVGDSRCYLLREGEISLLSRDHTLVARMVAEGSLTPEEAESHPQRSIVTRALGADPDVDVDMLTIALQPADRILLCSDGLSSVVPEERIADRLRDATSLEDAAQWFIDEANRLGGPDNITAVVLEVPPSAGGRPPRKPRARPKWLPHVSKRLAAWTIAVVIVLGGSAYAFRSWVTHSYYVGVSDEAVTIYRGLPTDFLGATLNEPVEKTDLTIDQVAPYYQNRLRDGIRVSSVDEARKLVASVIPRATPTVPTALPTPKASTP